MVLDVRPTTGLGELAAPAAVYQHEPRGLCSRALGARRQTAVLPGRRQREAIFHRMLQHRGRVILFRLSGRRAGALVSDLGDRLRVCVFDFAG